MQHINLGLERIKEDKRTLIIIVQRRDFPGEPKMEVRRLQVEKYGGKWNIKYLAIQSSKVK